MKASVLRHLSFSGRKRVCLKYFARRRHAAAVRPLLDVRCVTEQFCEGRLHQFRGRGPPSSGHQTILFVIF